MTHKKKNKLDLIRILKMLALQNILLREWKDIIDWEKIFANHISEKDLESGIYIELSRLNIKKTISSENGQNIVYRREYIGGK